MHRIQFLIFSILTFFSLPTYSQLRIEDFTSDSIVTTRAGGYKADRFKSIFLGSQHRKSWRAPVKLRVFDLNKAGLTVFKIGGSRQTTSLRLKDKNGKEYVLRSIDKTPARNLPKEFQETFLADLIQDQASTGHPYGAFTIAPMAEAINILHTSPLLVYIPYDTAFGEFAKVLAGKPALFEERADSSQVGVPYFGNAPNVISTQKMQEKLLKNHDNQVDQKLYIRARLFDMLIGDWGRHQDQWRWAEFDNGEGKIFKPIPRDRDHVYFKMNGILPYVVTKAWGLHHLETFKKDISNLKGLNNSAATLDRTLISTATKSDWLAEAEYIKTHLTDQIIESSIKLLPENVFKINGEDIIFKLKNRRDQLSEVAADYYKILSKEVNVTGSDKRELFEITRIEKNITQVNVYGLDENGNRESEIFSRTFDRKETKFVNLYGLGGEDQFVLSGKSEPKIRIRIVGGDGIDVFQNKSLKDDRREVVVFDSKDNPLDHSFRKLMDNRSKNFRDTVHAYIKPFRYNYTGLYFYPEYNPDDGVFLGAGVMRRTYGFRKNPYKTVQKLGANFASQTGAFNFQYSLDKKYIWKRWGAIFDAKLQGPQFVFNYFGFGNESVYEDSLSIKYYRVRGTRLYVSPLLYKQITNKLSMGMGPEFDYSNLDTPENKSRFIIQSDAAKDPDLFKSNLFTGIKLRMRLSSVDTVLLPVNGYKINLVLRGYKQIQGPKQFVQAFADVAFYKTFKILRPFTFAIRAGGGANQGKYFFFQAPSLGGTDNLRGYRRTRFYGDYSFYSNNEIRTRIFRFRNYLFDSNIGIVGFYDTGRVWTDQKSKIWHYGYGTGLWIEFFKKVLFSGYIGFSEDGAYVNFQSGFFF